MVTLEYSFLGPCILYSSSTVAGGQPAPVAQWNTVIYLLYTVTIAYPCSVLQGAKQEQENGVILSRRF